jgi:hypothetical protein
VVGAHLGVREGLPISVALVAAIPGVSRGPVVAPGLYGGPSGRGRQGDGGGFSRPVFEVGGSFGPGVPTFARFVKHPAGL